MEREETLRTIRDCGSAEMTVGETLSIVGMDETAWESDAEARSAFRRGRLETKLKVRKAVADMACEGDAAMVKIYIGFGKERADAEDDPRVVIPSSGSADDAESEGGGGAADAFADL